MGRSPLLLANLVLDDLDQLLESRGHRFCPGRLGGENPQTAAAEKHGRKLLEQPFSRKIQGVPSRWDRLLLQALCLPFVCRGNGVVTAPCRNPGEGPARKAAAGIPIEYLRKKIRKENRVQQILPQRCGQPGLLCVCSAMERCDAYRLRKKQDRWSLRPDSGWLLWPIHKILPK